MSQVDYGPLQEELRELAREKNALIIAHNYQRPEVQDVADFTGDSLELSRLAAETDARIILFCGVHFMAETAYILSPGKKVLLSDINAGCPMADMITAEDLVKLKAEHPEALVVAYVNTSAAVKAETDICCTSANAAKVVSNIPAGRDVIFIPDRNLAMYVEKQTGRRLIKWDGFCPTHDNITLEDILRTKQEHPQAVVLAHPECLPGVQEIAGSLESTSGMIRYAAASSAGEFIIATEMGLIHRLKKENPDKHFYSPTNRAICPNMKMTTLAKAVQTLREERYQIRLDEHIRKRALAAVEAMVSYT
ncbi:quinolinate synthase A [bacterium BMS3Abin01]|nr:quinolinate synthase A [bacterium BMS3Abin01]HDZ59301.1 quinolinate synthase NadA [Actinomycetota bacterium]